MTLYSRTSRRGFGAVASAFATMWFAAMPCSGQYCRVQDLGSLSTTFQQSVATGINNNGQVAGWTSVAGTRHAFLFQDGVMKDLGTLSTEGFGVSMASGINNRGQVVGLSSFGVGRKIHAALFDRGQIYDLGTLSSDPANHNSQANAINDRGQVVGYSETDSLQTHAFVYANGRMNDIGTLPGDVSSNALGINNRGQVVGYSNGIGTARAFLYENGMMIDLGALPGDGSSYAKGINERGEVVGWSQGNVLADPFVFAKGVMLNLAGGSGLSGVATAINNRGDVIGYADASGHSLLFHNNRVIDISGSANGPFLDAQAINDGGEIAGIIPVPSLGTTGYHAAVCKPVK